MEALRVLTPPELIILQKHIELGKDHLVDILGRKGFHDLLALARPDKNVVQKLKTDDTETTGNLILVVNTIITGCFGGWMGLFGMLELDLRSPSIFYGILSLATLFGGAIGYQSFRLTKNTAAAAIESQQTLELEATILKEIHAKRSQEIREIEEYLQHSLTELGPAKELSTLTEWVKEFDQLIDTKLSSYKKSPFSDFLQRKIHTFRTNMYKHIEQIWEQGKNIELVHPASKDRNQTLSPIFQKLIFDSPQTLKTSPSWNRIQAGKLILGLLPTLFGGFGSVFVYLTGGTSIAQAFKHDHLVAVLTTPEAKFVKIIIAILVTIYFGFSFLYAKRKSDKRTSEIDKKRQFLVKEEAALTLLDEKLLRLRKIKGDVEKIIEMFQLS
jgi:hypothetical protein